MFYKISYIYSVKCEPTANIHSYQYGSLLNMLDDKIISDVMNEFLKLLPKELHSIIFGFRNNGMPVIGMFHNMPIKTMYRNTHGTFKLVYKLIIFNASPLLQSIYNKFNINELLSSVLKSNLHEKIRTTINNNTIYQTLLMLYVLNVYTPTINTNRLIDNVIVNKKSSDLTLYSVDDILNIDIGKYTEIMKCDLNSILYLIFQLNVKIVN